MRQSLPGTMVSMRSPSRPHSSLNSVGDRREAERVEKICLALAAKPVDIPRLGGCEKRAEKMSVPSSPTCEGSGCSFIWRRSVLHKTIAERQTVSQEHLSVEPRLHSSGHSRITHRRTGGTAMGAHYADRHGSNALRCHAGLPSPFLLLPPRCHPISCMGLLPFTGVRSSPIVPLSYTWSNASTFPRDTTSHGSALCMIVISFIVNGSISWGFISWRLTLC